MLPGQSNCPFYKSSMALGYNYFVVLLKVVTNNPSIYLFIMEIALFFFFFLKINYGCGKSYCFALKWCCFLWDTTTKGTNTQGWLADLLRKGWKLII